jgi:hypothetical protein
MEDKSVPDNLDNPKTETKRSSKRLSIFSIAIITIIVILSIIGLLKLVIKKDKKDLSQEVFLLSDKSTLLFVDDENYILNYNYKDKDITMYGKYRVSYDEDINENVKYSYKTYIEEFKRKDYNLSFLELQNEELYINNEKSENGYINMYYILMLYDEDGKAQLLGYNVDTGIKVKFEKQEKQFNKYYNEITKGVQI